MLNNNNYVYGDQCGEFVCGYWGLKDLIIKQINSISLQYFFLLQKVQFTLYHVVMETVIFHTWKDLTCYFHV